MRIPLPIKLINWLIHRFERPVVLWYWCLWFFVCTLRCYRVNLPSVNISQPVRGNEIVPSYEFLTYLPVYVRGGIAAQ
jgi:hypothetical protein